MNKKSHKSKSQIIVKTLEECYVKEVHGIIRSSYGDFLSLKEGKQNRKGGKRDPNSETSK